MTTIKFYPVVSVDHADINTFNEFLYGLDSMLTEGGDHILLTSNEQLLTWPKQQLVNKIQEIIGLKFAAIDEQTIVFE